MCTFLIGTRNYVLFPLQTEKFRHIASRFTLISFLNRNHIHKVVIIEGKRELLNENMNKYGNDCFNVVNPLFIEDKLAIESFIL